MDLLVNLCCVRSPSWDVPGAPGEVDRVRGTWELCRLAALSCAAHSGFHFHGWEPRQSLLRALGGTDVLVSVEKVTPSPEGPSGLGSDGRSGRVSHPFVALLFTGDPSHRRSSSGPQMPWGVPALLTRAAQTLGEGTGAQSRCCWQGAGEGGVGTDATGAGGRGPQKDPNMRSPGTSVSGDTSSASPHSASAGPGGAVLLLQVQCLQPSQFSKLVHVSTCSNRRCVLPAPSRPPLGWSLSSRGHRCPPSPSPGDLRLCNYLYVCENRPSDSAPCLQSHTY